MTDPYIGQVQLFGFNFAPYQWSLATGQTLPIQQNAALFSLLGVQYGGNGTTTYQLPNFVNRVGVSQGQGPGLSPRVMGETFGENAVTLTNSEIPPHTHAITAYTERGSANKVGSPSTGFLLGSPTNPLSIMGTNPQANTTLAPNTIGPAGGSLPHENCQPFLAVNFSIALYGVFPSFN
ncbi:MAG: phage tail protein [Proteobacteria bacterium]|nr:phage tail protein [Pseudomonadota bacterium]